MAKMLLTSAGFDNPKIRDVFLQLLEKPASNSQILFIPAAAVSMEQLRLVNESKMELLNAGIQEDHIFSLPLDHEVTYDEVSNYDAMYVCGGSTFHLLNKIKETKFDAILKQWIRNGKLYFGVSAGSIVLGPKVDNQSGLHIIDTSILPHFTKDKEERLATLKEENLFPITPLSDLQALLVSNQGYEIIE